MPNPASDAAAPESTATASSASRKSGVTQPVGNLRTSIPGTIPSA